MAKDTNHFPEDGSDRDDGEGKFHISVVAALRCAEDFALRNRHRYVTVEHMLLILLQFVQRQGVLVLSPSQMADMQFTLLERLKFSVSTLLPSEGVRVLRTNDLSLALVMSEVEARPKPASLLHVVQAIFRLQHTFASKLLRKYGLTSRTLQEMLK